MEFLLRWEYFVESLFLWKYQVEFLFWVKMLSRVPFYGAFLRCEKKVVSVRHKCQAVFAGKQRVLPEPLLSEIHWFWDQNLGCHLHSTDYGCPTKQSVLFGCHSNKKQRFFIRSRWRQPLATTTQISGSTLISTICWSQNGTWRPIGWQQMGRNGVKFSRDRTQARK